MFKGQQLGLRIKIVIFVFSSFAVLLAVRGAYLQLIPNKKLSHRQKKLFDRTVILKPRRGVIYDRHNKELAISIPSQSLFADPQQMKEPYFASKKLSQLLKKPKKFFLKRLLNKKKRFVWLKRHLSQKEIQEIKSWKLKGLNFIKESKRFYTHNQSLSQVLGFTGIEGQGLEGIEKQYDEFLRGEPQKVLIQRDAKGRPLFMDFSPFISKVSGFDVYLTIDSDLQIYLEKGLSQVVANSKAESAIGIILSAESSEVLAMANIPNYNPNELNKNDIAFRRNRALTDIFEPGSTLKTFTLISALKKGISPNKVYSSQGGQLKINSSIITEANPKKKFKAWLNMSEILALSSNVGVSSMALDVGAKALRKTLSHFGFGKKTGIDFPGEVSGLLRSLPWRDVETATISFGHGIASTALQVANAYTAIANGGVLKRPFLVKKIKNPYTGEEQIFQSHSLRRVLSKEEARTLSLMLVSVTEKKGTGARAKVPGYWTAGKTGTAQKVDFKNKGYKKEEYISSFAGFIPAHDPKFVIYLLIDGAKDNFYASSLVAPLFSQVASYSVRQAGLSPTLLREENIILASKGVGEPFNKKSKKVMREQNKKNHLSSKKTKKAEKNFTEEGDKIKRHIAKAQNLMPALTGLSLRKVLNELKGYNLKFEIRGSGRLIDSIPATGQPFPKNKPVTLIFN